MLKGLENQVGRGREGYYLLPRDQAPQEVTAICISRLGCHNKARKLLQSFRGVNVAAGIEVTAVEVVRKGIC